MTTNDFEPLGDYTTINVSQRGGARRIELNRPEKMNAWDAQLGLDLRDAVEQASADDAVRALMIHGAGRGFSSGADLTAGFEPTPEGHPDVHSPLTERYNPIIAGIRRMPKPVLAAVHGGAVGIGCSLALACDLVLAAESSYFLLAFVNIGLAPDGGASALVPTRVGLARAAEMAMLGERIPAPRALEWGLVNAVHQDERLLPEAHALLERLAAGPTRSHAATKRQLNRWAYGELEGQLAFEAVTQQELAATADFAEGVQAFVEKRPAVFRG